MKKRIITFVSLFLLVLICSGTAFAVESTDNVPKIVNVTEEFFGIISSKFYQIIESIKQTDETNIPCAEELEHSWVSFDSTGFVTNPEISLNCETWISQELVFKSSTSYLDPFYDVDINLILVGNGRKYVIPGFWDGNNTWKVRFVCPYEGKWYFKTECTNSNDTGLNGKTGEINCSEYLGTLDVYKHGFVTTKESKKYFTYDDGTPFFYIGDTHWSLGDETVDMVREICAKRVSQGFTVFQSEPIGATFDLTNGVTSDDLAGFAINDEKFKIIADNGLTHANAEFFFPYYMDVLLNNFGGIQNGQVSDKCNKYLEKLTRYWVARYSSYPVMWTLGQEIDNDFYYKADGTQSWDANSNPYKLVAEYIDKYDPYDHPLSAHQENSGSTAAYGNGNGASDTQKIYKDADASVFRNVKSHNWYAAQYTVSKTSQTKFKVEKDYWYNSQGKPSVNYEGQYCYLWTKNFGSRMQGWCAYLSGMYGYGWGGHDTWSYTNTYDEDNNSSDGVDTITSEEKKNATWQDSLEYPSSYQTGYMRKFFEGNGIKWWNLIPRFDNKSYFTPCQNVYYCAASNKENTEFVVYFYSFTDSEVAQKANTKSYGGILTGTIGNLEPNTEYKYIWFNPITGETSDEGTCRSTSFGTYYIGERKWNNQSVDCDMVFCLRK